LSSSYAIIVFNRSNSVPYTFSLFDLYISEYVQNRETRTLDFHKDKLDGGMEDE